MLDIMYEIPKDENIGQVIITEDYIEKKGGPKILLRTTGLIPEKAAANQHKKLCTPYKV